MLGLASWLVWITAWHASARVLTIIACARARATIHVTLCIIHTFDHIKAKRSSQHSLNETKSFQFHQFCFHLHQIQGRDWREQQQDEDLHGWVGRLAQANAQGEWRHIHIVPSLASTISTLYSFHSLFFSFLGISVFFILSRQIKK